MLSQISRLSATAGPYEFSQVLEKGMEALAAERKRGTVAGATVNGSLYEIADYDNIAIISDLHGDTKSLFKILDGIGYEAFLSNPRNKMVFLGDYVDRGSDSIGILYAICYLKHACPDSVVLMRGNHEAPAEFPFSSHDLPYEIKETNARRRRPRDSRCSAAVAPACSCEKPTQCRPEPESRSIM